MNQSIIISNKGQRLLFILLLLVHTTASYYYISQQNITFDEPQYIEYAKRWLHGKPERVEPLDDSKSPVVAICWVPRIVRQIINPNYHLTDYGRKDQAEGRYMMILFSFLAAYYVYKWCRDLYGVKGWWLPLLLLLFDPLYLAYSTLITTDLACGSFLVALLYHFRKYLLTQKWAELYKAAMFTGLAIATKQSLVFVLVLLPIITFMYWYNSRVRLSFFSKKNLGRATVFLVIVLFVINACYYFSGSFMPLGKYVFTSHAMVDLQNALPFFHWVPVPLPQAYIQSLDMIKAHAEYGAGKPKSTYNGVYLFGNLNLKGGYWYYYFVVFFYKMPIGNLFLFAAGLFLFFRKFNRGAFFKTYLFLVIPILFYWAILSFFNNFQTGIRHLLIIFPLLYIGLGKVFYEVAKMKPGFKMALAGVTIYCFISVGLYYPFIIPYTNEFVRDKKMVYKIMVDSSIDYGQSDSSASEYVMNHSGYMKPSTVPMAGKFALPMAHVINTYLVHKNPYNWYQQLEPKGLYRNVVLLYEVTGSDLSKIGLKAKTEMKTE